LCSSICISLRRSATVRGHCPMRARVHAAGGRSPRLLVSVGGREDGGHLSDDPEARYGRRRQTFDRGPGRGTGRRIGAVPTLPPASLPGGLLASRVLPRPTRRSS
jgi:hypothetical protein